MKIKWLNESMTKAEVTIGHLWWKKVAVLVEGTLTFKHTSDYGTPFECEHWMHEGTSHTTTIEMSLALIEARSTTMQNKRRDAEIAEAQAFEDSEKAKWKKRPASSPAHKRQQIPVMKVVSSPLPRKERQ